VITLNNDATSSSLSKTTKAILNEYGIKLNKNLGQNYLIDRNKRDQIIKFANLTKEDVVLEIGPGIGTLTIELAKRAKKVIAIEQDSNICQILENRLKSENIDNVELINDDALNVEFPKFNKIISNLPYQISSPITFKFLNYDFQLAILMYQKEFASRMNGKVGSKDYSRLSAMLYFKCDVETLASVSAESFIPKPKVDSTVVKLTPKLPQLTGELKNLNIDEISKTDFEIYSKFVKALFQHRNKKVKNALIDSRHIITDLDKKEMKAKLNSIKQKKIEQLLTQRITTITPEEILYLSIHLNSILKE
jgi:16S rRNA (adenine1518-N6/adenine1519-N6)-dimethyltransferase